MDRCKEIAEGVSREQPSGILGGERQSRSLWRRLDRKRGSGGEAEALNVRPRSREWEYQGPQTFSAQQHDLS